MSVLKYQPEFERKFMTKPFKTLDQLTGYLLIDLYTLYDEYREADDLNSSDLNYFEGIIDRTQVVLAKCGIEYMEYDTYIETVVKLKWIPA